MNIPPEETAREAALPLKDESGEAQKDALSLKERVDLMEEQIRKTTEEYAKILEVVEKLKIVNSLLYQEVCKTYATFKQPIEDEQ